VWLSGDDIRRSNSTAGIAGRGTLALLPALLFDQVAQLAFHGFEGVVDDLGQRFVGAVGHLFFVGDKFVPRRNGDIDATTVGVTFVMGPIGLLDSDVAAVDVVAKFLQSRCVFQNEIVDLVRFFQAAISDVDGQLHGCLDIKSPSHVEEVKPAAALIQHPVSSILVSDRLERTKM
jgi:hypothetical protein